MYPRKNIRDEILALWHGKGILIRLIMLNSGIFIVLTVLQVVLFLSGAKAEYLAMIEYLALPADVSSFLYRPWSLVTYFFLHQGWWHILFNMLVLYWFGRLLSGFLSDHHLRNLYLLGGLVAGLFFMLIYNLVPYYEKELAQTVLLGASGAVYAVVVGTAVYMPNYSMHLIFIGPVRIRYIALAYVFLSFIGIVGSNSGGALAHLGGAWFGYLYITNMRKGRNLGAPIDAIFGWFLKKNDQKVQHTTRKRKSEPRTEQVIQKEMNAILDKISESGYDSLSKKEKETLFRLSGKKRQ